MHQSPYLARTNTRISRQATTMAQQQDAIVINMGELNITPSDPSSSSKKKQDTLFGPNIGIVAKGPEWTESREKVIDELTPEIVRNWISRSKEVCTCSCTGLPTHRIYLHLCCYNDSIVVCDASSALNCPVHCWQQTAGT